MTTVIKNTNTRLYRGTKNEQNFRRVNRPVYFTYGSTGKANAGLYATKTNERVYTYKPTRPLKLLDLGNYNSVKRLLNSNISTNDKNKIIKAFVVVGDKLFRKSSVKN